MFPPCVPQQKLPTSTAPKSQSGGWNFAYTMRAFHCRLCHYPAVLNINHKKRCISGGRMPRLGKTLAPPPRGFVWYGCCAPRLTLRRATWAVKSSYFDDHCPDGDRGGGAFAIMSALRSYGSYMHRGQRAKFTSADSCIHEFISKVRTRQIKLRP